MKKLLKYLLPSKVKKILKYAYACVLDVACFFRGKSNEFRPPRRLDFVGTIKFDEIGSEFLGHFKKLGGLHPGSAVLDIGAGIGRMALPMTKFISKEGHYLGFDIVKKGIDWCKTNITPQFKNFKFEHADIKNHFYNEGGIFDADKYEFPSADSVFDFCFATSVFTHMLPAEVERYFEETARVTKPGGTILFTFFLIPEKANDNFKTEFCNFSHKYDNNTFYSHKDCIEAEVGFNEKFIKNLLHQHGFENIKVYEGKWKNPKGLSYQDILIAQKRT